MGEAKRRRLAAARTAEADAERLRSRAARWAEIEELASEDYDDRACRTAHGFPIDVRDDRSTLCPNGCGLTYDDVSSGKIRKCLAA